MFKTTSCFSTTTDWGAKKRKVYHKACLANSFCLGLFFVFSLILVIVQQHTVVTHDLFWSKWKAKNRKHRKLCFFQRLLPRRIELMIITGRDDAKRKLECTDIVSGVFLSSCWDYQVWGFFFHFTFFIDCSQLAWRHTKLFLLQFDSRSLLNTKIVTLPKPWKINL